MTSPVLRYTVVAFLALPVVLRAGERDDERAKFRIEVAPLLAKYCIDCHGAEDPEGELSLQEITPNLRDGDNLETWRLIREQLRFGDMPPEDAEQPTDEERRALLGWIRTALLETQWPGSVAAEKLLRPEFGNYVDHEFLFGTRLPRVYPAPPRIWRLRPDVYESRMLRTGLVERPDPLANGLNEPDGSEFKDYAAGSFIDEAGATPLLGNAKALARAMLSEQRGKSRELKRLAQEEPPDEKEVDAAVGIVFVRALGRRPTAEERERFAALHANATSVADHRVASRAMVTAILMQPEFLFRTELGNGGSDEYDRMRLSQREIAYALSYALTDEPVHEFLAAARAGELATREEVAELVRGRLSTAGNPRIGQFLREYFHYPFAGEVFKDRPDGGEHDAGMLVADLEMTIAPILQDDRNVLARLLTIREFFVNAKHEQERDGPVALVARNTKTRKYQTAFNLPIDWKWGAHLQPISFPEDERAGVLTHPAWLVAWSGNFENHPVQRGKWIRTHLLGGTVPDVPIGVDARVPEMEHTTFRERLRLATAPAECWRCHRKMDPLGLPFERYDHYGRFQRRDAGQPVDTHGMIDRTGVAGLDGTRVEGPTEMMEILARSPHVEQVFVRHAFRYLLGRNETLGDANTLQDAHAAYRESGGSLRELVVSLLSSDSFLYREIPNRVPPVDIAN